MGDVRDTAEGRSSADGEPNYGPFSMSRIGRHTLIYGLGVVLSKAVSFFMLPIYTRFLTPSDYGVMELIEMTLDIISIVAGAQIAIGIFRYYHKAATDQERDAVVSTSFMVLALSYCLMGALTYSLAPWLADLVFDSRDNAGLIRLAAMSLAASSFSIAPLTAFRVREQSTYFVLSQLGKLLLQVGLNLYFLVELEMGVRGVFMASLIASSVVGAVLGGLLLKNVGIHFSRQATRDLVRYGIPLIGTQMATFAVTFGDRYFLQAAADTAVVGVYSLAYQFGFLLAAIGYMPFEMIWQPARFEIAARPDRDVIYSRAFIYLNILLISTAVGLSVFVQDVLHLMATPAFYSAAHFVPVIVIAYVLQGWTGFQDVGIHMKERTEFITAANWVSAVVALVGYAIFIPRYLGYGAAGVTVVAFAVRYAGCYWASQRLWRVHYEWRPVIKLIILGFATVLTCAYIESESGWLAFIYKACVVTLFLTLVVMGGILPAEDRHRIRKTLTLRAN
ncbi:MAG: lipopolysaccharide biosynthesis protein [Myxococcota bacterium]|nr:lipopolysaccharide biosynthesis protein [Myxococcota bacterium]